MTDERTQNGGARPDRYDDDRLLAYALDLEDDPELPAAAEADAGLAARLAAMRDGVEAVGAQVRAAVPAPDESYTDLSGGRWSGLSGFFEAPAGQPRRQRRRWWVLAPVAALLVLAVVVGIVAVYRGGPTAGTDSVLEAGRAADKAAPLEAQGYGTGDEASSEAAPQTAAERLAEQLDRFAVVVLARAREATGALQRFAVVRIFKGDPPQVVELDVDDDPADEGKLHLLMLVPVGSVDEELVSPEPIPSLATTKSDPGYGTPLAVSYMYEGEPTLVREFEDGTDPDSVDLPLP